MASSAQVTSTHTLLLDLLITILLTCPFASCVLVPQTPIHLQYHQGALLAGYGPIKLHLTYYGNFTSLEKHAVTTFLNSLSGERAPSHIVEVSSSSLLQESVSSLNALSTEGRSVHMGRRGLSSSEAQSKLSAVVRRKPSVHFSFKLKARKVLSSSEPEENGSSSKLTSAIPKASGFSSSQQKASGSSLYKQEASGSFFPEQEASGYSTSSQQESTSEPSASKHKASGSSYTVADWWSLTQAYVDLRGNRVSQTVLLEHEISDNYSLGKLLSHSDIAILAKRSARDVSHDPLSIHVILTAADVGVEGFCMHACGQHAHTQSDGELGRVLYTWVGNARDQCPGYCSWPFARAEYGPDMDPLGAPNSASADGMIINLAKVLVEAATNPYGDGYHLQKVGIGGVCTGVYGEGAFPGYPGHAYKEALLGASFNVMGIHQSKFLLPYIWNPLTFSCAVHA
ncbi:hypothetical protein L7F22_020887 [Adiantum nelumboides]|nr:hypothetical protein [Adiantum nelumboides]